MLPAPCVSAAAAAAAGHCRRLKSCLLPCLARAGGALAQPPAQQAPDEPCKDGNYTAADCPNGSCHAGQPNGCGSRSLRVIAAQIVPDRWPLGERARQLAGGSWMP